MKTIKVRHMMSIVYGDATVRLDGNLTPEVRRLFTSGQCHALAVALNELLGWRIAVCIDMRGEETHFVVVSPNGRFADVNTVNLVMCCSVTVTSVFTNPTWFSLGTSHL